MSDRHTHLDGLRGLAALMVVIGHGIIAFNFALYTGLAEHSHTSWDVYISGAPMLLPISGNLSVCVFFALSGYVLSRAFSNTDLGIVALLSKRYVRLTIPIALACLISYALLASGAMDNQRLAAITKSTWLSKHMQQVPSLVAALQEGFYRALITPAHMSTSYDSSLWTMPIELWGSVILMIVFNLTALRAPSAAIRARNRIWLLSAWAIICCGSYLGLFAVGALLNLTQAHRKVSSTAAAALFGVGLFLGTVPASEFPWAIVQPFTGGAVPIIPGIPYAHNAASFYHSIGAILILTSANAWHPFRTLLSSKPFQFLGQISYPLYLIHIPLLMSVVCTAALAMLAHGLPYSVTFALSLALFLAVSLLAATALLFICERPSITLSSRIGNGVNNLVEKLTQRFGRRPPVRA